MNNLCYDQSIVDNIHRHTFHSFIRFWVRGVTNGMMLAQAIDTDYFFN